MPLPIRYVESEVDTKKTASASVDQENDTAAAEGDSLPKAASLPILDAVVVPSNRLQALGVHNISTVIRQLGSIAKHAENIMGDIADVLISYHQRTLQLEERTRRLREEVLPGLDPEREGTGLNTCVVCLFCYYEALVKAGLVPSISFCVFTMPTNVVYLDLTALIIAKETNIKLCTY